MQSKLSVRIILNGETLSVETDPCLFSTKLASNPSCSVEPIPHFTEFCPLVHLFYMNDQPFLEGLNESVSL